MSAAHSPDTDVGGADAEDTGIGTGGGGSKGSGGVLPPLAPPEEESGVEVEVAGGGGGSCGGGGGATFPWGSYLLGLPRERCLRFMNSLSSTIQKEPKSSSYLTKHLCSDRLVRIAFCTVNCKRESGGEKEERRARTSVVV